MATQSRNEPWQSLTPTFLSLQMNLLRLLRVRRPIQGHKTHSQSCGYFVLRQKKFPDFLTIRLGSSPHECVRDE